MARKAVVLNETEELYIKMGRNHRWRDHYEGGFTGYTKVPKQPTRTSKRTSKKW